MENMLPTLIGLVAAACTALSYIPQARKSLRRHSTSDLSLKMLSVLFSGLLLWIVYGLVIGDAVIVIANLAGAMLVAIVLICKIRDVLKPAASAAAKSRL
jgi:MtN3 and saliva related transmembrane protein